MKARYTLTLWLLLTAGAFSYASSPNLRESLDEYFATCRLDCSARGEICRIENLSIDDENRVVRIFTNETFGVQPFTREKVQGIYADLRALLPESYKNYRLMVFARRILIDELVPFGPGTESESLRRWNDINHRGYAWVSPLDRRYPVGEGLEDRHISLWASHGRYYSQSDGKWMWQRPNLFCTNEDLFSQTFVVPLLIPMLENAGAVVFTPRERDWQRHEAIVDNDTPDDGGHYAETTGRAHWQQGDTGFAHVKAVYTNFNNPFTDGTYRMVETQPRRATPSTAIWTPALPAEGRYAVYVSYATLPTSVPDATYTVRHRGIDTRFRVNQQMGGATWVYLGTFDFATDDPANNCVRLSNHSNYRGHVTADGVRFGGGMGNIARGDSINLATSGMPRCLEGARYAAQWAGMPTWVYANKGGSNDYGEDINVRSHMTNHLAGGSAYVPGDSGLHVPIELSLAFHTDAGYTTDSTTIGSLAVYTTDFNDGRTQAGLSRLCSRDVADMVMQQVQADLSTIYGPWTRRQTWDRNYSETREPVVPAIILEMLSHQNFYDLRLAHDPTFKFTLARAIYKAVLRYIHAAHGEDEPIVQPLPITAPAATVYPRDARIDITWQPVSDPLEATARPTEYIVYHAIGDGGFDNGTVAREPRMRINDAARGVLHRFRIAAVNAGGSSMLSEEVCAFIASAQAPTMLIVDAFDRLAGPQPVESATQLGFDLGSDPGVPLDCSPAYCGRQLFFNPNTRLREGYGAVGYSGKELEGIIIAGNTRDWASRHAKDIIAVTDGGISIATATAAAVAASDFDLRAYTLMDIACGLNRADGYSLRQTKALNTPLRQAVATFALQGGSILLSGAYTGTDMRSDDERLFTREVLKYEYAGALPTDSITSIDGLGMQTHVRHAISEEGYCVSAADCLAPTATSFCAMTYAPTQQSAAVAYQGTDYRVVTLGFPIEAIADDTARCQLWSSLLQFLTLR